MTGGIHCFIINLTRFTAEMGRSKGTTTMANDRVEFRLDLFKLLASLQYFTSRSEMIFDASQSSRSAEARADDRQAENIRLNQRENSLKMAFLK